MDLNGLNRCSASRTHNRPKQTQSGPPAPKLVDLLTRRLVDFFLTFNFSLMVRNSGGAGWNRRASRLLWL